MALSPRMAGIVNITTKDINGNSIAKVYNQVLFVGLDYAKGMINVVDNVQGSFYFSLYAVATFTYTAVGGQAVPQHSMVIS